MFICCSWSCVVVLLLCYFDRRWAEKRSSSLSFGLKIERSPQHHFNPVDLCQWAHCPLNNDGLLSKYVHQTMYVCVCVCFSSSRALAGPVCIMQWWWSSWSSLPGVCSPHQCWLWVPITVMLPWSNQTLLSPPTHVNDPLIFSPRPNTTLVVTPVFGLLV